MVPVFAMEQVNVQGQPTVLTDGPKKLPCQHGIKAAEPLFHNGSLIVKIGPVGNIYHDPGKSFVHWQVATAITGERLSENALFPQFSVVLEK
jgi:hypothetical protein